ncbi:MAG: alpha/beta hydrolase [Elusimicrobiales bacterium]
MIIKAALTALLVPLSFFAAAARAQSPLEQVRALAPETAAAAPRPAGLTAERGTLPREAALERRKLFDYAPEAVLSVKRGEPSVHKKYSVETIDLLLNDPLGRRGEYLQRFFYYRTARPGPRPTVVVFTPFSGTKTIDAWTAVAFAKRGYNAVIVVPTESLTDASRPIDQTDDLLIREAMAGRMAIDLLETFPETDKDRIYATGISMGGIRTALFFGVEPRVRKAAEIVGGGDLSGVIADTRFTMLRKVRDARMEIEGIPTLEEFRAYMQGVMTVDPLDFGCLREPEDLLMMMGEGDVFVPDVYQKKLYDAFSRPAEGRHPVAVRSGKGHLLTAADIGDQVKLSAEFFENK